MTDTLDTARDLDRMQQLLRAASPDAEGPPPSYAPLRTAARRHAEEGRGAEALRLLVAGLDDLARFYRTADDDSDAGWHRAEQKDWERWALAAALRDRYADDAAAVPEDAAALLGAIARRSTAEGARFLTPTMLVDPPPALIAAVGGTRRDAGWLPREEALAASRPPSELPDAVDAALGRVEGEPDVALARLHLWLRVATRWHRDGAEGPAAEAAILGLVEREALANDTDLPASPAFDAVADELAAELRRALVAAVDAGDESVRREALTASRRHRTAVAEAVARALGDDEADEPARVADLRARWAATTGDDDDRHAAACTLAFELGHHLDDAELLALCEQAQLAEPAIRRLVALGRDDDALDLARRHGVDDEGAPRHALQRLARVLLDLERPALAERLVGAHIDHDALHAALATEALAAQGRPEMQEASLRWLRRRPTAATYDAIRQLVPAPTWANLRPRLLAQLDEAGRHTTLVDIYVAEDDAPALEALIERLDEAGLEHARARAEPLRAKLSEPAQRRLAPPGAAPAPARRPPPAADAAPPDRVTHPKFGSGKVVRAEGRGDAAKYVVAFDAGGEKTLLARFLQPAD